MGHPKRKMEDSGAQCNMNCEGLAKEIAKRRILILINRDCSCEDILLKNVVAFCPCLKCLLEGKLKRFGLILLEEEISKQPGIGSAVWLLLVTLNTDL